MWAPEPGLARVSTRHFVWATVSGLSRVSTAVINYDQSNWRGGKGLFGLHFHITVHHGRSQGPGGRS